MTANLPREAQGGKLGLPDTGEDTGKAPDLISVEARVSQITELGNRAGQDKSALREERTVGVTGAGRYWGGREGVLVVVVSF